MRTPALLLVTAAACASGPVQQRGLDVAPTDAEIAALLAPAAGPTTPPETVAPAALEADLFLLQRLLPRTYAGAARAEERDLHWKAYFAGWRAMLHAERRPRISIAEAFAPMAVWRAALADPLSGPAVPSVPPISQVSLLPGPVPAPCDRVRIDGGAELALEPRDPAQHPRVALVARDGGRRLEGATYLALPHAAVAVHCGRGWVDASPVAAAPPPASDVPFLALEHGVVLLRAAAIGPVERGQVESFTAGARAVILDLRGLAAGAAGALRDRLPAAFGGTAPRPGREAIGSSAPPSWMYGDRHLDPAVPGPALLVVVESGCRAGCEQLVYELAATRRALIVGLNTGGSFQHREPATLLLPGSKVPFRLAQARADPYGDGRSVDGYGLDVDVVLATPDLWSDAALAELAATVTR
jgi:hypothetical protein